MVGRCPARLSLLIFNVALGCGSHAAVTVATFDLGADFSLAQNPNGPWRYGYSTAQVAAGSQFQLDGFAAASVPIGFWHPNGQSGYYPYVAENSGDAPANDPTSSWALRPGEVAMEGSPLGQYSIVQFAAARAGTYDITASFAGIHFRLSSTDVHVLNGDEAIFDALINGYGGDPSFHPVQGQSPTAEFHGTRRLQTNDVLSFAVGVGPSMDNTNDTTGLFVHLELVQ